MVAVDDGKPTDLVVGHGGQHVIDVVVGADGHCLGLVQVTGGEGSDVKALRHHLHHQITIGDNTLELDPAGRVGRPPAASPLPTGPSELGELGERAGDAHARVAEVHDHCDSALDVDDSAEAVPVVKHALVLGERLDRRGLCRWSEGTRCEMTSVSGGSALHALEYALVGVWPTHRCLPPGRCPWLGRSGVRRGQRWDLLPDARAPSVGR